MIGFQEPWPEECQHWVSTSQPLEFIPAPQSYSKQFRPETTSNAVSQIHSDAMFILSLTWPLQQYTVIIFLKNDNLLEYTANVCIHDTSLVRLKRCSLSLSTANSSGLLFAVLHYNHTTTVLQVIVVARTIIGM